jgi:uncharacterized protein (DUF362 family)/NAD-dependent dihydropyrimidine dehydrogenase PreA subunit
MKVTIARCADYEQVSAALSQALTPLGGMKRFVSRGQKVLLKPNIIFGKDPQYAVNTHPLLIRAVILSVRSCGGIPSVGDSPGQQTLAMGAEASGIAQVCNELKVPLVTFDEPIVVNGAHIKNLQVTKRLSDFDVLINLPKLKTHMLTGYTGAVKNLFGCVPGRTKSSYHIRFQDPLTFSEMLLDLAEIVHPELTIMDAVVAMEGFGPGAGAPRAVGVLLASESPLALDTVACEIIGFSQHDVATLAVAHRWELPHATLDDIEVIGAVLKEVAVKEFKRARIMHMPRMVGRVTKRLFTARPVCVTKRCIRCGRCHDMCPAHAITMRTIPRFDYSLCIRCFCCQEVCPAQAIVPKSGVIARSIGRMLR